jgi:hypothetical protein
MEEAMKTMIVALVALSALAGIAGQATALDAKALFEHQDRYSGGTAE